MKSLQVENDSSKSVCPSSIGRTFFILGSPKHRISLRKSVRDASVTGFMPLLNFLKSVYMKSVAMPLVLKKSSASFRHSSHVGSSASRMTVAFFIPDKGTNPVGMLLLYFLSLRFLNHCPINPTAVYFKSSRISCFAAFHLGMSIFVPITSTTLAAMMDPTSPHSFSVRPREWA